MRIRSTKLHLMACASLATLGVTMHSGSADAGGFAVREQSTQHQGASFAGAAACTNSGISGMYWNPAAAACAPSGLYTESHAALILGDVEMEGDLFAGAVNLGRPRQSGNIADPAIVPASYYSYRISDRLVAALSINAPFGLVTEPGNSFWAGQVHARTSSIKTYNFAPTLAYHVTPSLAVGVGVQIQYIEGRLKRASGIAATSDNVLIHADDFAVGWTIGLNWKPTESTSIGLGFRSAIDHNLEGTVSLPSRPNNFLSAIHADVTLPEMVTFSIRQGVTDRLRLLGTVEWTNWSRLQKLDIVCAGVGSVVFCPTATSLVQSLHLGWHDGWFFSLGGEYDYSERLTLRAGLAYEISPIQNADERTLRTPDRDRLWASIGATYKWNEKMAFDLAYTHIFGIGDDDIDRTEGGVRFIGKVDTQVDILSFSLKYKIGDPHAHAPLK